MGTCLTTGRQYHSQQLSDKLNQEKPFPNRRDYVYTFALCGLKRVGKSTLMRQLQILHEDFRSSPSDAELHLLRKMCVSTIVYLLSIVRDMDAVKRLQSLDVENALHLVRIADIIQEAWSRYNRFENILSHSYAYKDEFQLNDNIAYFMDDIQRIMSDSNEAFTNADAVRFYPNDRHQPLVSSFKYIRQGARFCVQSAMHLALGKKHMHYLGAMQRFPSMLLYIAALSNYCEVISDEGSTINALQKSLDDFDEIVNSTNMKHFSQCRGVRNVILFLNKRDIFRERLRNGISLSVCFGDEYTGPRYPDFKYNQRIGIAIGGLIRNVEQDPNGCHVQVPCEIVALIMNYSVNLAEEVGTTQDAQNLQRCYEESVKFIRAAFQEKYRSSDTDYSFDHRVYTHVTNATDTKFVKIVMGHCEHALVTDSLDTTGLLY